MSKEPQDEAPLYLEASMDINPEGTHCYIDLSSSDERPLTPQIILDAVADMLTAKFSMEPEEWDFPDESLDS